jgi:hypothetical protein
LQKFAAFCKGSTLRNIKVTSGKKDNPATRDDEKKGLYTKDNSPFAVACTGDTYSDFPLKIECGSDGKFNATKLDNKLCIRKFDLPDHCFYVITN